MTKRIILAAILGGLIMFIWDFVAHDVLPLGEAGVKALDNEQTMTALKANVRKSGLYIFPMQDETGMTSAQKQAAMQHMTEKMQAGPTGIMVIYPQGRQFVLPKNLATQCGSDMLAMLLAGVLVAWATRFKTYGGRVIFVTLLGLFPSLAVGIPLWNWYGFPTVYTLAQTTVTLVGFFLGGLVVAELVRPAIA